MSRLTELLQQARRVDPQLGADLQAEIAALTKRRTFGLVFEQHQPEAVDLPGRLVRRGDKVRVLVPRGETTTEDERLWRVVRIDHADGRRVAELVELDAEEPEQHSALTEDLVVVAEFRDRIYPGLVETGRIERGEDKPFHTVINAENFHCLEMLTYTHRHSIDAIYIDPPYNTGARDWKYNNDYVESDDDYRHSKWLAMMERRLKIARELLDPEDSVLIVTIDEKEYLRLGLLLEQLFPEAQIQMVSSVINPKGVVRTAEFARVNEYLYFCLFGTQEIYPEGSDSAEGDALPMNWQPLRRSDIDSARHGKTYRRQQFYPIYVNQKTGLIEEIGEPIAREVDRFGVPQRSGCDAVFPVREDGTEIVWGVSADTFRSLHERGYARTGSHMPEKPQQWMIQYLTRGRVKDIETGKARVLGRRDDGSVIAVYEDPEARGKMPTNQWERPSHNAQHYGTLLNGRLMPDRRFPFPKSLYAVEDALQFFVKGKPNAVVLDFFAGSGTTAHAVMRLNHRDGGKRQCISVTNNEVSADEQKKMRKRNLRPGDSEWEALGICEYITKPRLIAAISGLTPAGDPIEGEYKFADTFEMARGFHENAAFFNLTYEAPLSVSHNRAFQRIAPLLWLRSGSRGRIIRGLGEDGWDVSEAYAVLENLDQVGEFSAAVAMAEGVRIAYIVTDDDSAFQMVCRGLPASVVPVRLYESYLHNFEIDSGRSL